MHSDLFSLFWRKKTWFYITIGVFGVIVIGFFIHRVSEELVVRDAERDIQNLLLQHKSLHYYIQRDTHPALYQLKEQGEIQPNFYSPEMLSSSYMIRVMHSYLNDLRKDAGLSEIYYKMAAINPRNPVNAADDFERSIIKKFNADRSLKSDRRIIERNGRQYIYYAIPFLTTNEACLKCHGKREDAPYQLQARYAGMGGLGDKVGQIRAIESIRIPLDPVLTSAHVFYFVLMGATGIIAFILFLSVKLRRLVRKRTEELRESKARFLRIADNAKDMIYRMSIPDGVYEYVSPASGNIFGYMPEEFYKTPFLIKNVIHPDWMNFFKEEWEKLLKGASEPYYEYQIVDKSGDTKWLNQRNVLINDGRGTPVAIEGIVTDVTEEKHLEEQLLQSQKMEAIGKLAGGVAHDFNNLLMAILGYSESALETVPTDTELYGDLSEIKKAGDRAALLTRQLLAFSRKQILEPRVLDLNETISTMEKMLHRLIGEDIDLVTRLAPDLGTTKADPGQLQQILLNLAVNARDAMPAGGKLTIETRNADFDDAYVGQHLGVSKGSYVMVAVSDNGCGIDKETLNQIFDPFFTTKPKDKGTGLGLSTVYGIVKQSGGHIFTYSEVGKGSAFKIYFPRLPEISNQTVTSSAPSESLKGTATVLLVEDEIMVRGLVRRVLEKNGYNVLEAANGDEALQIARNNGAIHLLITDVVLPKLSGKEIADRLTRANADLKVLFISGYTDNAIVQHGILEEGIEFLQKPFSSTALLEKVSEICQK